MSWNGFGLEGAVALGEALNVNNVLEELDISSNRFNAEAAVCIAKGVPRVVYSFKTSVK